MTADRFQQAFTHLMQVEGGFVNDPADNGGATKYGITLKTLGYYMSREATIDDIKSITLMDAERIYRVLFWEPMHCDEINDLRVAVALFDQGVNRGIRKAVLDLQRAINQNQSACVLNEDGAMGPATLSFLNGGGFQGEWYIQVCRESYRKIVEQNQSQSKFLNGWMNRVDGLEKLFA